MEVKYLQMDTDVSGNILLSGSSTNNVFFSPDMTTSPRGFPIFQFFDTSTCSFTWSRYIPIDLEQASNVAVTYRRDYANIGFGFVSSTFILTLGQMSLAGALNILWNFTASTNIYLLDLLYDDSNDQIIAAIAGSLDYKIIFIKDFGTSTAQSHFGVNMNEGRPFTIILYDSTYIFVVGRAQDGLNAQPFHHLKLNKSDGTINSVYYKQVSNASGKDYRLINSDKNTNGAYIWSCGTFTASGKAIYSVLAYGNLYATQQTAPSKCYGIYGISATQAFAIRAILGSSTNYFLTQITLSSSTFSSSSYNMDSKIDVGISLEKAYFKSGTNFAYIFGKYQFSSSTTDFQGYLMKMSTDFANPSYSSETCYQFTLALIPDTTSLFEATPVWDDVSSPSFTLFSRVSPSTLTFTTLSSSLSPLQLITGSYQTYVTCIIPSTAINQNYDLGSQQGSTSYSVPVFTLCPTFATEIINYSDAVPVTGVIIFTPATRTFDWSALTTEGTYTLAIIGTLTGTQSVYTYFTLTITRTILLVSSAPIAQNYVLGSSTGSTYTVPAFTTSPTGQESIIVYSDVSVGKPSGVKFSGRLYNWSTLTTPQTFILTMEGRLGLSQTITTSFTVTITSLVLQPQTATNQNYMLYFGSTSYLVPAFVTNPTGSESLIAYSDVSTSIPSSLTFNPLTRQYLWSNSIPVGTYSLTMLGSISYAASATVSFTLTITAPLILASTPTSQLFDLNLKLGSTNYTVPEFTTVPSGIENLIVYSDLSVFKPTAVIFNPSLRLYDWSGVNTTGSFNITMKAFISGCIPINTSFSLTITQISQKFVISQNLPPFFDPILQNITLELGNSIVFTFPLIIDADPYDYGKFFSLNIGAAISFVRGTYPTLLISPTLDPQHIGEFPVQVTIKDTHDAKATFQFQIIVKEKQSDVITTSNASIQLNKTLESNISDISSLFEKALDKKVKNLKSKNFQLSASILSINNQGLVTIIFNKDIYVIRNLILINQNILSLKIIGGPESDPQDLNITSWNATQMESRKIIIQIQFQSLIKISMHDIKDQLEIEFKNPDFIIDQETKEKIKAKTIISKRIPKQMPKDQATLLLQSIWPAAKSSINAFVVGNFALQFILAASLQMLWGMISVMQIIVHMPLLNVQFPANAIFFYRLIIDITSFNLIPDSWMKAIKDTFFNFQQEEFEEQFTQMGYQSESSIENLGSMFLYLGCLAGIICFVLLIVVFKNKYQIVNKLYTFLANLIFWNLILRNFLEGYMEYAISSLINIYKLEWDSGTHKFSSIFSIIIFAWIFLLPFLVWFILWRNFEKLEKKESIMSFGSIYMELRAGSKNALLYNVFFMLRRLLFTIVILVFKNWPFAQIQIIIFHCILLIIYNKLARPFENPLLNRLEIFNELCIMGTAYHLFVFTQYVDDVELQYNAGWSMILITILNIVVNMAFVGYASLNQLKLVIVRLKLKFKAWRARKFNKTVQKYSDQQESNSDRKTEDIKNEQIADQGQIKDSKNKIPEINETSTIDNQQLQKKILNIDKVIMRQNEDHHFDMQGNIRQKEQQNSINNPQRSNYNKFIQNLRLYQTNIQFEKTMDNQSQLFKSNIKGDLDN